MEDNIPVEKLYSHPVVQELLEKIETNKVKVDLDKISIPYIIKDKVLMSPGVWNNYYYSEKAIHDAFLKSRWDSKEIRSLYADHEDNRSTEWVGEVTNPRWIGGHLIGDLVIVDKPTAQKLAYGAKMGISPKVHGVEDNNEMIDFEFDNFSVVINPAVKTAYINNMEVNKMTQNIEKKLEKPVVKEQAAETPAVPETAEILETPEVTAEAAVAPEEPVVVEEESASAVEVPAVAEKPAEVEMSTDDIVSQIIKLAQMLAKKEKKYPYPEEEKNPPEDEEKKKMKEMEATVKELSEELKKVTAKLNEPAKKAVKTAELSSAASAESMVAQDLDGAMMSILGRIGGM